VDRDMRGGESEGEEDQGRRCRGQPGTQLRRRVIERASTRCPTYSTWEDADTLTKYEGHTPGTVAYNDFVQRVMG
jgi:hypothetical protein